MNISYKRINAAVARDFADFILPVVSEDASFDEYMFYAALDDDHLIGLLVADPRKIGPEILSIGLSPEYQKKDLAPELLSFALEDMVTMYDGSEGVDPNYFGATIIADHREAAKLCRIFQCCGFKRDQEGVFYQSNVGAINESEILHNKKIAEFLSTPKGQQQYRNLNSTTRQQLKFFGNQLAREKVVQGLDIDDLEKNISFVKMNGDTIEAALLFFNRNGDTLQNCLLYHNNKSNTAADLLHLFTASANAACAKYSEDVKLSFFAEDDKVKKIILKVFPGAVPAQEMITYMLPFYA